MFNSVLNTSARKSSVNVIRMRLFNKFYTETLSECKYVQPWRISRVTEVMVHTLPAIAYEVITIVQYTNTQSELLMLGMGLLIFSDHTIGKKYGFKKIGLTSLVISTCGMLPYALVDNVLVHTPNDMVDLIVDIVEYGNVWFRSVILRRCIREGMPTGTNRFLKAYFPQINTVFRDARSAFRDATANMAPKTAKELREFAREQIKKGWGSHKPPK